MFRRNIEEKVRAALVDTPVVLLNGARQTGKSTLATKLTTDLSAVYITLDDATALSAASSDASGFLRDLEGNVVIDEVQKAPQLFPAIKKAVDADRRPGRYLLTGSANVFLLPRISESLAGRMEVVTLWPLSQGELLGRRERFLEGVFSTHIPALTEPTEGEPSLLDRLVIGGYPEVVQRKADRRREAWFASYITAILHRDVRDLANIEGLTDMPRLLALLAGRSGGLLNISELSRSSGMANTTLKRYVSLLEATFLLQPLSAWSANLGKRLIKSPRIHLVDSGLVAHLTGQKGQGSWRDTTFMGHLLECFVVAELRKQKTWSEIRVDMFHFRTTAGREVDLVLEDNQGRLVGVEIKLSSTVARKDLLGLEEISTATGKRFLRGVVLYGGENVIPLGERLVAMPISALWRMS